MKAFSLLNIAFVGQLGAGPGEGGGGAGGCPSAAPVVNPTLLHTEVVGDYTRKYYAIEIPGGLPAGTILLATTQKDLGAGFVDDFEDSITNPTLAYVVKVEGGSGSTLPRRARLSYVKTGCPAQNGAWSATVDFPASALWFLATALP